MNIKKEVIERLNVKLTAEQNKLKYECSKNAGELKRLAEENTIKKREIARIGELIRDLNK
jgi:hypothetical protein